MLNLSVLLEDSARTYPNREAVVLGTTRLTYAQVEAAANRVANLLVDRGIWPGDKVALSCPNLPYFPIVYYGILKAGAVVVPLNILLKGREIAYHLADSEAKAYFCFEGDAGLPMGAEGHAGFTETPGCEHFFLITADPEAETPIEGVETMGAALRGTPTTFDSIGTTGDDPAVLLYTSGTTGQAKGAELSHANLVLNALACNRLLDNQPASDTHLLVLPLFHSFGATVQMNAGFSTASTLVLLPRFDARQAVSLMQQEDITVFAGVPTMWWGLLQALTDDVDVERIARNLRVGVSGGASLPAEITKQVEERLGVQVLEGYGLSETSPVVTFSDPAREPRPGSIGVPIWGVQLKLVNPDWSEVEDDGTGSAIGEIAVKGHNVMKGYHGRPEATAEAVRDGWFRTGDLARRDKDGFYYIVDRLKDMVISGGENIYPAEVERVLVEHPDVLEAAVVGVPDPKWGETVLAVLTCAPGTELTVEEVREFAGRHLARYKLPTRVQVVEQLPRNASGKLDKRELRRLVTARATTATTA
jgi:long-chain acyl-CoA synthetase